MSLSLNSVLKSDIQIKVVDVGANPIDGSPVYASLLKEGHAQVVGFEPEPKALAELNQKKGPHETYLPTAVGDGKTHTLHFCAASGMTSLFQPNAKILDLMHGFSEWGRVLKTEEVMTTRLDDVPEVGGFDLLKLDIQGAELMALENAVKGLQNALVVQAEVEFMPMYVDQPLFSDVDLFMRRQGFVLHRFDRLISRVIKPLILNNDIFAGLSQLFWTDAIYVRDFTKLELFTPEQLLRMALILNDCYASYDLVTYLLVEHDKRTDSKYGQLYQTEGLQVKALPPQP
jgi:FkbM family methyltransferase